MAAIETALERFAGIDRTDTSFAALMAAQERIPAGDSRNEFAADFLRVQGLWEFLDPSPVTAAHRADYRWLAQVYESVQPAGTSDALLWQRLGAKTLELVHGHITEVRVTGSGLDEVIVDAETIEAIRQLALPDPARSPRRRADDSRRSSRHHRGPYPAPSRLPRTITPSTSLSLSDSNGCDTVS